MNCDHIKESISSYIDMELTDQERKDFEDHIRNCKDCQKDYKSLLETVKKLNSIGEKPLPKDFEKKLRTRLNSITPDKKVSKFNYRGFSSWNRLAAGLIIGLFVIGSLVGIFSPYNFLGGGSKSASPEADRDQFNISYDATGAVGMNEEAKKEDSGSDGEGDFDIESGNIDLAAHNIQEKIIYSASISLEVNDFEKTLEDIKGYIKAVKGYIERSSSYTPHNKSNQYERIKEGFILIRIPSKSFDEAIGELEGMGNISNKDISGDNISSQYRDLEIELKNLEVQEDRILEIMKKADRVEDVLEIERELNRIRTEINSRKAILKNYDQLVDYSSIELSIREEKISTHNIQGGPFSGMLGKLQKAFIQSINIIVDGAGNFIIFIARAIPFILIILLLLYLFKKFLWERIKNR